MRDEEEKTPTAAAPPSGPPRDELEKLRREEDEISHRVARDIEALRRRDPQSRLARWQ